MVALCNKILILMTLNGTYYADVQAGTAATNSTLLNASVNHAAAKAENKKTESNFDWMKREEKEKEKEEKDGVKHATPAEVFLVFLITFSALILVFVDLKFFIKDDRK